ncbi:unnamed protein product [Penicillium glandicola]
MGQDSVFVVRTEYLEGFDDEAWVNVGSQFLEDPDNEEADWITVVLPEEMDDTHSDEDIMRYVLHNIQIRRAIVSEVALHNMGIICISIPIPASTADTTAILVRAEADTKRWLELIRNGMARETSHCVNLSILFKKAQVNMANKVISHSEGTFHSRYQSLFRIGKTGNKFSEDPRDNKISWVTVELPYSKCHLYTDQMLLEFAILEIQNYRAVIYQEPQHWMRYECISFPVKEAPTPHVTEDALVESTRRILDRAETVAKHWLVGMRAGMFSLDRRRMFGVFGPRIPHRED